MSPTGSERDCSDDRNTSRRPRSRTRATAVPEGKQEQRLLGTLECQARADVHRAPNVRPVEVQASGANVALDVEPLIARHHRLDQPKWFAPERIRLAHDELQLLRSDR